MKNSPPALPAVVISQRVGGRRDVRWTSDWGVSKKCGAQFEFEFYPRSMLLYIKSCERHKTLT